MKGLARFVFFGVVLSMLCGCASSGASNPDDVRARDQQRKDVAKTMPGNDIPKDPADD
jgi:hypothetical protein